MRQTSIWLIIFVMAFLNVGAKVEASVPISHYSLSDDKIKWFKKRAKEAN